VWIDGTARIDLFAQVQHDARRGGHHAVPDDNIGQLRRSPHPAGRHPTQPVHPGLAWGLAAGHPGRLGSTRRVQVSVDFEDPVPVRPERLIAQGLCLTRNEVLRRVKCDISLRRPTTTGFTFIVM